jgi:hypothetical protein
VLPFVTVCDFSDLATCYAGPNGRDRPEADVDYTMQRSSVPEKSKSMSSSIDTCFEALDKVQQVERLDHPCRMVVIVYSAWGLIENGGFQYFFESNFPGDPPYDVFTQAFRSVGLTDIALRFSKLVSSFPFEEPHKFRRKRQEFIDLKPSSFITLMTELEDLVYAHENIEKTLNSFLQMPDAS